MAKIKLQLVVAELQTILSDTGLTKYEEFIESPLELVQNLYYDMPELSNEESTLHQVCHDIASKCALDIKAIRDGLFREWIQATSPVSMESLLPSYRYRFSTDGKKGSFEFSLERRIIHILGAYPIENSVKRLLSVAYDGSAKISTIARVRSLNVLIQMARPETISEVHQYQEVLEYLRLLYYLLDSEELRISVRTRELHTLEKAAFAKSLWVSRSDDPRVVQFICNLMLDYKVYDDLTLWERVLDKMASFDMFRPLITILESISSNPELEQLKNLPKIWRIVVNGCLNQTDSAEPSMLLSLVLLIQKCPYLVALDHEHILKRLEKLSFVTEMRHGAAIGLATLWSIDFEREEIDSCVSRLLANCEKDELSVILKSLSSTAVRDETPDAYLTRKVFGVINQHAWFDLIVFDGGTLSNFVEFVVIADCIDQLLHTSIKFSRLKEAHDLVRQYYAYWSDKRPGDDLSDQEIVQVCLHIRITF